MAAQGRKAPFLAAEWHHNVAFGGVRCGFQNKIVGFKRLAQL